MESPTMEEKTSVPVQVSEVKIDKKLIDPKLGKIKVAFLYVLIGGLIVSALISVVAILIGQFNEVVVKALLTTFIFVTHSLLILAFVSADRHNTLGKNIFPTTIFIAIVANMFTTTLGTWGVWDNDISWRAFLLYTLAIGSAFIATGVLRLRVAHRNTNIAVYATVFFLALLTAILVPWVLSTDASWLGSFYYRVIGAITILGATTVSLSVIFNRIAVSQNPALVKKPQARVDIPGGLLAIYIVIGTVVGFAWMFGLSAILVSASSVNKPTYDYNTQYYNTND
ncbi:MAG TPA: hypothetical protein VIM31_00565 [Candidatus Microsaccharimonas sp.]